MGIELTPQRQRAALVILFSILLFCYHLIFHGYFPNPLGRVGHDFALALPSLLDGCIWFSNNGLLDVPWFTPSFCGGQPLFADPQSGYYSVPQFLSFAVDPLTASYLTLLGSAAVGFWGFYFLLRRIFKTGRLPAVMGGALYMFNGFLSHRMILGELGYHAVMLTPWIALLLLSPGDPARPRNGEWLRTMGAGVMIAYWLQTGLTTLMIPTGLGVFLIACVSWLQGARPRPFLLRSAGAVSLSLALCAAKLVASLSFLSHFQRTHYPLPGAADIWKTFELLFKALFLSSETVFTIALESVKNVQWTLFPHEWAYGLTLFPFLIIMTGIALAVLKGPLRALARTKEVLFSRLQSALTTLAAAITLLLPVALATHSPDWNAFLKTIPIINATSCPFRWFLLYIPFTVLMTCLLLDRQAVLKRCVPVLVPAGLLVLVLFNAFEEGGYYSREPYDPRPVTAAHEALRQGKLHPEIRHIGAFLDEEGRMGFLLERNDFIIHGISQLACYNPIFGYRLEKFPKGRLHPGPVLQESDGVLNLKNPICYVFPEENGCLPGDHFLATERRKAEAFVRYRPISFEIPKRQRIANLLTEGSLLLTAGFFLWSLLRVRANRSGNDYTRGCPGPVPPVCGRGKTA